MGSVERESLSIDGHIFVLNQSYDTLGHLASISYPSGETRFFTPNALGQSKRVSGITDNAKYFANGALKSYAYDNGFNFIATQTPNGLPLTQYHYKNTTKAVHHQMTYDANNNLTFLDDKYNSAYDLRMGYDQLDRLSNIIESVSGPGNVTYDNRGNITQYALGNNVITYEYNSLNQLDYVSGSHNANYLYDDIGNVINNSVRAFDYNAANQMYASGSFSYTYDGNGKRVKEIVNDTPSYSFYGSNGKLMYRLENNIGTEYYYLSGSLVGKKKGTQYTLLHSDFLGTPLAQTNFANNEVVRKYYQPFGEQIGQGAKDVGYTGHMYDDELGLNYMQARYYDPVIGRFYSNDPLGALSHLQKGNVHGFGRYTYGNNNPYRFTDPDGKESLDISIADELKVMAQSLGFSGVNDANTNGPAAVTAAKHQIAADAGDISDVATAGAIVAAASGNVDAAGKLAVVATVTGLTEALLGPDPVTDTGMEILANVTGAKSVGTVAKIVGGVASENKHVQGAIKAMDEAGQDALSDVIKDENK
jgi:RHS repeat-associated protein